MKRAGARAVPAAAWLVLALGACIDTPLSLGHHRAPAMNGMDDGTNEPDAELSEVDDAAVPPPPSGGTGGAGGTDEPDGAAPEPPPDAGPPPPDATPPRESPCRGATFAMELRCARDDFMGPPGGEPAPMTTSATLTIAFVPERPGRARASAPLAFSAWNASFTGRFEGELDCARGTLRALILDGQFTTPGAPPGPFFGQLDGALDAADEALSGTWWHGPDVQLGPRCSGTWTAARD